MRELIKETIKDTAPEPYFRWLVKRTRGIKMPFGLVKNEIYDRQAAEVIKRVVADASTTVDVGCHKGQFLKLFLNHAPHGRHYAFEPIPHLAKMLQAQFPSVKVFDCALSDKSGPATFYVIADAPTLSGLNERTFLAEGKSRMPIEVRVERLDALIPEDANVRVIKIDVEGAEGLVISGAINTIRRNKPYIILEHGRTSSEAFGITSDEIYDMLVGQCGLRVSLLSSWLRGGPPLSKREFSGGGNWYFLAHPAD
jgi:FkbM family methyltransferase